MAFRVLAVFAVVMLGCSSSSGRTAGEACQQQSDCEASLDCLDIGQFAGTTCTVVGKICSVTCTSASDPSCTMLGSGYTCLAGCGSDPMVCAATAP
ncbi:MAG TPA: hypothetical protein VMJ10_01460 [Kofleriaceae bacterium]|nr:hypothetical protein [Kofleriaceae bacterium]